MSSAAPAASRTTCSLNGPSAILGRLAHSLALAMLGLLVVLAVLFLVRRLSGALVQPLSRAALVSLALLLAAVVAGLRAVGGSHTNPKRQRGETSSTVFRISRVGLLFAAVPALAAFVILTSLTLPGSPALGIATAWFVLVAAEGATWLFLVRGGLQVSIPAASPAIKQFGGAEAETGEVEADEDSDEESEEISPDLVQQFTRLRTETGGESIHAIVRAQVPSGEKLAVVHLAFCPPLEVAPQLTAHALDAEAEVKLAQTETYGVRLEVRLAELSQSPSEVLVEVLGESSLHAQTPE